MCYLDMFGVFTGFENNLRRERKLEEFLHLQKTEGAFESGDRYED
jgi:hypothetical protein